MLVSLLDSCEKEIYHAKTFRADVVRHLYPHAKVPDQYIHFPLIPRDESTNEGMALTNVAILNSVGLLKKEEHGKYSLGDRAQQRLICVDGDALTVRLHGAIYDRTLRQITQLGNRKYIDVLLAAHDRVVIQKGQFHQLMHQLGAIYSQFYGGFIQAMQVANGVKRINGDPVKGGYQAHELFAVRIYRAANRLMFRAICSGGGFSEILTDDDSKQHVSVNFVGGVVVGVLVLTLVLAIVVENIIVFIQQEPRLRLLRGAAMTDTLVTVVVGVITGGGWVRHVITGGGRVRHLESDHPLAEISKQPFVINRP